MAMLPIGQVPDPLRAHGAWVYLLVSVLAGVLVVAGPGRAAALLAGGGLLGLFVLAGALAIAPRRVSLVRFGLGLLLTVACPMLALRLGSGHSFLQVGLLAVPPILLAAALARKQGFLSPGALGFGVTALVVAAPVAATAGGAGPRRALLILATLAPVFLWRTWRLARAMGPGWTRRRFERQGLIESGIAVGWAALAVVVTRLLG